MRTLVLALVLAVTAAGCATSETTPSASVTTLMPDSERWFKLSWEVAPEKQSDQRRLRGYVENTYGEAANRVQLLGQALDNAGGLVGQRIWFLASAVPGFGRSYYEIPGLPAADQHSKRIARLSRPAPWSIRQRAGATSAPAPGGSRRSVTSALPGLPCTRSTSGGNTSPLTDGSESSPGSAGQDARHFSAPARWPRPDSVSLPTRSATASSSAWSKSDGAGSSTSRIRR